MNLSLYVCVCAHALSYVVLMWQGYVPWIITAPSQSQLWPNTNCKRIFPMSTPINQKIHRRKIEGFNFFLVLFVRESLGYIWDLCLLKKIFVPLLQSSYFYYEIFFLLLLINVGILPNYVNSYVSCRGVQKTYWPAKPDPIQPDPPGWVGF